MMRRSLCLASTASVGYMAHSEMQFRSLQRQNLLALPNHQAAFFSQRIR